MSCVGVIVSSVDFIMLCLMSYVLIDLMVLCVNFLLAYVVGIVTCVDVIVSCVDRIVPCVDVIVSCVDLIALS